MPEESRMGVETVVRTALVGPRSVCLEGVASILAGSRYAVILRCADHVEFRYHGPRTAVSLCVVVDLTAAAPELCGEIARLRAAHPELCLVVVSCVEAGPCIAAGADGHLLPETSPEALIMALGLFVADARPEPMTREHPARAGSAALPPFVSGRMADGDFSLRELNVLAGIARGESNKHLARRLCLAESTVKAHVRVILKKAGAANRTQLAVWASLQKSNALNTAAHRPAARTHLASVDRLAGEHDLAPIKQS